MPSEADNSLVIGALATVAVISSAIWLWHRLNGGSGLIAGIIWLATMGALYVLWNRKKHS